MLLGLYLFFQELIPYVKGNLGHELHFMLLNMVILNIAYYCNTLGLLKGTRYVM